PREGPLLSRTEWLAAIRPVEVAEHPQPTVRVLDSFIDHSHSDLSGRVTDRELKTVVPAGLEEHGVVEGQREVLPARQIEYRDESLGDQPPRHRTVRVGELVDIEIEPAPDRSERPADVRNDGGERRPRVRGSEDLGHLL